MTKEKLTPKQIFEKLEDLHAEEEDLLNQLKDQVCECDDNDLDADFEEDI